MEVTVNDQLERTGKQHSKKRVDTEIGEGPNLEVMVGGVKRIVPFEPGRAAPVSYNEENTHLGSGYAKCHITVVVKKGMQIFHFVDIWCSSKRESICNYSWKRVFVIEHIWFVFATIYLMVSK